MTAPAQQALTMLKNGNVNLSDEVTVSAVYERCLVVMAVLNSSTGLPSPGIIEPDNSAIALIVDNQVKGISKVLAVTIQATPEYSLDNWERERAKIGNELLAIAKEWIKAETSEFQVHGWLYNRPIHKPDKEIFVIYNKTPMINAGDTFTSSTIDSCVLSGFALYDTFLKVKI